MSPPAMTTTFTAGNPSKYCEDWHEALRWLEKFADQKLSFTDCLSFSLMRREGIPAVFGFDHHFALAGYDLWPRL
jgi:predicted nucleic acid-binding protein